MQYNPIGRFSFVYIRFNIFLLISVIESNDRSDGDTCGSGNGGLQCMESAAANKIMSCVKSLLNHQLNEGIQLYMRIYKDIYICIYLDVLDIYACFIYKAIIMCRNDMYINLRII